MGFGDFLRKAGNFLTPGDPFGRGAPQAGAPLSSYAPGVDQHPMAMNMAPPRPAAIGTSRMGEIGAPATMRNRGVGPLSGPGGPTQRTMPSLGMALMGGGGGPRPTALATRTGPGGYIDRGLRDDPSAEGGMPWWAPLALAGVGTAADITTNVMDRKEREKERKEEEERRQRSGRTLGAALTGYRSTRR